MTKVYVASAWWRDCDPFVGVVATTRELAEEKIQEAMKEELDRADKDDDENVDSNDLVWSGVHEFGSDEMSFSEEHQQEINEDGFFWQDSP